MRNESQGGAPSTFNWPNVGWLAAALGLPAVVGVILKDFAEQHILLSVALLGVYCAVVAVARFAGGVASEVAQRWRPRLVERIDGALVARLSRSEHGYRRWILNYLKKIDLQGLATVPNSVPAFDQIYIDVSLVNRPQHQVSGDPLSDRMPVTNTERLSISSLLRSSNPRVLAVLGAPGSGKTTLLRQAARQACRRRFGRRSVPIILSLREHAAAIVEDPSMRLPVRAVPAGLDRPPAQSWFESNLRRGRCVVLLDGLDEVGQPAQREAVVEWVDEQIRTYPKNHYVLTSRRHGYPAAAINSADVVQVRQLSAEQIEQFVDNWYSAVEPDRTRAAAHARQLREQIKAHSALDDMSVNPLLLTMIVNVHRERGVLPRNRVELYREICEVLLWRRRTVKGLESTVSGTDKQGILQILALNMLIARVRELPIENAIVVIRDAVATFDGDVDPRQLLAELVNDGILVEPETGAVGFCHKTFQEYLASVEIQAKGKVDVLVSNIEDDWWRETTILYTAQYEADIVLHACLASQSLAALELAFDCTEQGTRMAPSLREQMNDLLNEVNQAGTDTVRRHLLTRVVVKRYLRHTVKVGDEGCRSTHPVPTGLYRLFMAEERNRGRDRTPDAALPDEDDAPVTGIRYEDASAFVAWVNRYAAAANYRLPRAAEAEEMASRGLLGDADPSVWVAPQLLPWHGPNELTYIRWTAHGSDHPYRIDAEQVEQYLCRDIYLAVVLILGHLDASPEQLRGRRPAAGLYRAIYRQDLRTVQGRRHGSVLFGPLDPTLARSLTQAFAHEFASFLARTGDSVGRRQTRQLGMAIRDLADQMGVRIAPDLSEQRVELNGASEIGARLAAAHDSTGERVRDLLVDAAKRHKPLPVAAIPIRWLSRSAERPLRDRTVNALSDDASTCTEIDFARTTTFEHASLPWMRELGGELNKSVTSVFEREVVLSPVIATLFRLTALCLASESDVRRGPREIRAACQQIVTAVTILELRLNGPTPPNEVIVLTRE